MKLKLANIDDLNTLAQFFKALRTDEKADNVMTDEEIKNQMKSFLLGTTYKIYFLEENSLILGYGMIDITRSPNYLRHLFILPQYRQKGYGKQLIKLLMEKYGLSEIDIDVFVWNQSALDFYNKMGFKPRYLGMRFRK